MHGNLVRVVLFAILQISVFVGMGSAQDLKVTAEDVECIPIGENAVAWTAVENNLPDTEVRLYFRRLHDMVEDTYYVRMNPVGDGRYWGLFPKAEDREFIRHELEEDEERDLREAYNEALREAENDYQREEYEWARWWRAKELADDRDPNDALDQELIRERASIGRHEERHWLREMDDATFEEWLERQTNEPAEFFTAVHDVRGDRLARSKTRVAEVRGDCEVDLTPEQLGEAQNMTIGETATWQQGEEVFHWLCEGVVTRRDPYGVLRNDEKCRACVIAWWNRKGIIVPATIATVGVTGIIISDDDEPPASPISP